MTFTSFALKNIMRNRFRSVLTMTAIVVAIVAFMALRTLIYAWTSAADYAAKDRIVTRHKITFVMTLPRKYVEDLRQMPEIKEATWANWFGGRDPAHDREFFGNFGVDAKTYFKVYSEMVVPEDQMREFESNRSAAVVGDVLAKKMGWKIGDRVTLESGIYANPPDKPWTFTIAGIYTATAKSVDRSSFLFHWDFLNESIPAVQRDKVGWIVSRAKEAGHAADLGKKIDKMFDDRDTQTLSQDESSFNSSFIAGFSAILKVVDYISVVILVILLLILGNTIAMGVRERTNEYGTLRAIGFVPQQITAFIVGESVGMAFISGLIGVGLSYIIVEKGIGRGLEENAGAMFPYVRINPTTALIALLLATSLGILAALIPARIASKIRVTEALRRIA